MPNPDVESMQEAFVVQPTVGSFREAGIQPALSVDWSKGRGFNTSLPLIGLVPGPKSGPTYKRLATCFEKRLHDLGQLDLVASDNMGQPLLPDESQAICQELPRVVSRMLEAAESMGGLDEIRLSVVEFNLLISRLKSCCRLSERAFDEDFEQSCQSFFSYACQLSGSFQEMIGTKPID